MKHLYLLLSFIPLLAQNEAPLIPRTVLFGNPEKCSVQISGDGKYLSYLAPLDGSRTEGALNIWIRTLGQHDDQPITQVTERSIEAYSWSNDSKQLLYISDNKGDENWLLYGIDLQTRETTCYTPFENVQTRFVYHDNKETSTLLLGLNKDNPASHDIYTLDLTTKELTLIAKDPGNVTQWIADKNLQLRAAKQLTGETAQLLYREDNDAEWEVFHTYDFEDASSSWISCISQKHNCLYIRETKDSNTARFLSYDLSTKQFNVIAHNKKYDLGSIYIHPDDEIPLAIRHNEDKPRWEFLAPSIYERIITTFTKKYTAEIYLASCDKELRRWIVYLGGDTYGGTYYLYNDDTQEIEELFKAKPDLDDTALAPMEPITFTSRDGLTLHGYLTCPLYKKRSQLPLVLVVHGGPWLRDSWGYNSYAQWLANRGYAVLQVNFRGSSGYGKKFLHAGDKQWGAKMHDDLIDGVNWTIEQGIADPKKVAIFGGSYGGYAALCGAAFTPDIFCCAIDIVGITNLLTWLEAMPPYWDKYKADTYQKVGNPETEAEMLKERSPLFKAGQIKIPMLIAQGAHDPRVKQAESEQIVEALEKNGIEHTYMLFEDEGHGFMKAENRLKFFTEAEKFLANHLGGRSES